MLYAEAKELYNSLNWSLPEKEAIAMESAEEFITDSSTVRYLIEGDEYDTALEGALDKVKSGLQKIGEFFHKLVLRFQTFIRSFIQNQRRKKATKFINDMHGTASIKISDKDLDTLWKLYHDLKVEGWKEDFPEVKNENSGLFREVPMSKVAKYLQNMFSFSKSMDETIRNYCAGKADPSPSFLNANNITFEEYPGFLHRNANKATQAIKMLVSILGKASSEKRTGEYTKKKAEEKEKKTSERNQKFAQKQADKIKKKFGKDSDVTVVVTKKKKE